MLNLRPVALAVALPLAAACRSEQSLTEPEASPSLASAAAPPSIRHRIAFSGVANGGRQIYTIRDDGTGLTQLTSLAYPLNPSKARWSPAGPSRIAFLVYDEMGPGNGKERLAVIQSGGSGFQYLTPDEAVLIHDHRWSPDGAKLAYVITDSHGDSHRLLVVNADGSGLDTLDNGARSGFGWSPDGQRLAYFRDDNPLTVPNESGIWTVEPDGTGRTRIRETPGNFESYSALRFSPDGWKIAGCHHVGAGGPYILQVMDATGTGATNLPLGCYWLGHGRVEWSPNGDRILVQPNMNNLYTIAPDGSDALQLTTTSSWDGSWSRQGTRIAYVHPVKLRDGSEDRALFIMSANGNHKRRLTPFGMEASGPSWGP